MDEFDFDDQRLPVRRGPPTDDAVPVLVRDSAEVRAVLGHSDSGSSLVLQGLGVRLV